MLFLKSEDEFRLKSNRNIIIFYSENNFLLSFLIKKLEHLNEGILFVNVSVFKNFIKRFDVKNAPTIIFFKNGREKKRITDVIVLDNELNKLLKE